MKFKIIAIMVFVLLSIGMYKLGKAYVKAKQDNQRLTENIASIDEHLNYYKSKNGHLVAQNKVLVFRNREFKKAFPKLQKEIKDLKLKPKRVTSISSSVLKTKKSITASIRDSLIHDTIKARVFDYKDEFYTVYGIAVKDTQEVQISSTDSLIQVVYKGKRKRPYLWIFSKRRLEQVISNKNPNAKISYAKHIEIIK